MRCINRTCQWEPLIVFSLWQWLVKHLKVKSHSQMLGHHAQRCRPGAVMEMKEDLLHMIRSMVLRSQLHSEVARDHIKYGSFYPNCWQLVQPYQKAQKLRWTYLLIWPQHFVFLLCQDHRSCSTQRLFTWEKCTQYIPSVHTKRVAKCRAPIDTRLYQREDQCMCERRSWRRYVSASFHQDVVRNDHKLDTEIYRVCRWYDPRS